MARTVLATWNAKERDHNPKSADWYWALGILAAASFVVAILFGNLLIALLILTATTAIALHSAKHPPVHKFTITEEGLYIGEDLHPFERMLSFSTLEDIEGIAPPVLSIKTESVFAPHLVIPLVDVDMDHVYNIFVERVDEGKHHHSLSDLAAHWLGL